MSGLLRIYVGVWILCPGAGYCGAAGPVHGARRSMENISLGLQHFFGDHHMVGFYQDNV
jgi:hypothetical protein